MSRYGSGMPNAPPNNPSMYPQNMPFGAGFQAPPNQAPYPPHQQHQAPYPTQAPYPNQTPYPSSQPPYPPTNAPYPPIGHHSAAPAYPTPPFGAGFLMPRNSPHHSPSSSSPYPPQQHSPCPYPSSQGQHAPQQQPGGYYPGASNMAQCFSEMRGSINGTRSSPKSKGNPTLRPPMDFDPVKDSHALRKAMKGFGTDEDAIINILCRRTNEQRQEIQRQYKTHFGKDLIEDIKSETSGNFERLLVALLRPIVDFYVTELNEAMSGIGTDEEVLIEILCTLSNAEIHTIKNAYLRTFGRDLESELKSETSGNFKRLLVSLCTGARDESGHVDVEAAKEDAKELLRAGELRAGTDESTFNMILCQRNFYQLKLIFDEYKQMTGHTMEKAIKSEFSGDIMDGLLAIYNCVSNKSEFFAKKLHKSMAGIGTNDSQLIRLIVTRCEIDLQDIKVAFEKLYGKSLKSWIKGDTSGHYKHALYALIGEERSS